MIAAALALLLYQASPPPAAAPAASPRPQPAGPVVALETSLGRIRIALDRQKAPITVDNFLQYAKAGHYDATVFHRVIPGFMVQGGGMDTTLKEKATRPPIRNEARNGLRNTRGTIAMARTDQPDTATAQFFINVKDNPMLDFGIRGAGYAVFGEVIEGMDVVDKIVAVPTTVKPPHSDVPRTPVIIKSARVEGAAAPATRAAPAAKGPGAAPPKAAASPRPKPASPRPSPRPASPKPRPSPQS